MTDKPVYRRALARRDAEAAVAHYAAEGGEEVALRFVAALEETVRRNGRRPATGSLRHGHEIGIEGLRALPLRRFPYLVFYREAAGHLEIWRILHMQRDLPRWLGDLPEG